MTRLFSIPLLALCACTQAPGATAPAQPQPSSAAAAPGSAQESFARAVQSGQVSPQAVQEWRTARAPIRVVDVRESAELTGELGHIEGVEHVPLAQLASASAGWDKQAPLVLVCKSGRRSAAGAEQLKAQGFVHVASMAGGMQRWNEQGLPVSR